jgi:hypothetical protein
MQLDIRGWSLMNFIFDHLKHKRIVGFWVVPVILVAVSVLLYKVSVVEVTIALLGLAIIWTSILPGLFVLAGKGDSAAPFFPLIGLFYAVFFGLPVFTVPLAMGDGLKINAYGVELVDEIRAPVLILAWAGIALMVLFFYGFRYLSYRNLRTLRLPVVADQNFLKYLYWSFFAGHLLYRLIPAIHFIPSIGQFFEPIGFVGICGLYLQWRCGQLSVFEKFVLSLVFFPLEIYVRVKVFFLTDLLLFLMFLTFVLWREKQFKVIAGFAVLGVFLVSFYAASTTVRTVRTDPLDKLTMAVKVYAKLFFAGEKIVYLKNGKRSFGGEGRFGALVRRTGHIWIFHRVYELTPEVVPYWRGETYRPLLTSMIPRLFYAEKPLENAGFRFGYRYGILKKSSSQTSLNLPWMTEMLANFGVLGVLVGMSFIGIFLAFLDKSFNAIRLRDAEFAFGSAMMMHVVYPESNFSVMTGSMILLFVSLYICFYLTARFSEVGIKSKPI